MVGAVKTHLCLATTGGREEGGQGIELREVRPRRSSSCQKRSQKSAKSMTGLKGRPQLFRFGQLGGPGVKRAGALQKLLHCHYPGKAIGHFARFI